MSEHAHAEHGAHGPKFYVKIWAILLVLLTISLIGPVVGEALSMQWITLITAFGIAFVKAWLVAKNFMHVNVEPKFVLCLMATCLAFMLLFFAGAAPDIMKHDGMHWENVAAKASVERGLAAMEEGGHHEEAADDHGGDHH